MIPWDMPPGVLWDHRIPMRHPAEQLRGKTTRHLRVPGGLTANSPLVLASTVSKAFNG